MRQDGHRARFTPSRASRAQVTIAAERSRAKPGATRVPTLLCPPRPQIMICDHGGANSAWQSGDWTPDSRSLVVWADAAWIDRDAERNGRRGGIRRWAVGNRRSASGEWW